MVKLFSIKKIYSDKIFKKEKPTIHDNHDESAEVKNQIKHIKAPITGDSHDAKVEGKYPSICFRYVKGIPSVDYTKIPEITGELYQFDPSTYYPGNKYIVEQGKKSDIIDYDPRAVPINLASSPQRAYLAVSETTQKLIKQFWASNIKWWKAPSTIFAVIMLIILFVATIVILG